MKNLMKSLAAMSVAAAVVGGVALARPAHQVTDAQVQAVIDARLHEMLVKLNAQHSTQP
jgi:hypothetical protein